MSLFNARELDFSIVNIEKYDSSNSKDNNTPFSFFDFIKYLKVEYAPEKYSPLYSEYLKTWYSLQDISVELKKERFKQFYKEFIQQIILNFTTQTERDFLKKADYNSSTDLDIVIPFYANRLTEIATFYKTKRESGKYVINEHKIKGSVYGLERAIFDSIYNYLVNTNTESVNTIGNSLSSIVTDFGIGIAEYVDVYGSYFDLDRNNTTNKELSSLRNDLYDNNLLDVSTEFYTDPEAVELLRDGSFLALIDDFKINSPDFTENDIAALCDPQGSLFEELNEVYTVGNLSLADVYNLKRQLISKYVSCDFYFINTSSVGAVSGLLFEAQQPTTNLLNLQTGDFAAVQSTQQRLLRDTGLFFKPDDFGIFKLNSADSRFVIDTDNLTENKVYIFPDPSVYGNVGVNALSSYPFVHVFDFTKSIRSISSGVAVGDPKITNKSLTFEPYTTKQRESQELLNLNALSYRFNFSDLYNKGVIRKMAYDRFGNEYALFKTDSLEDRDSVTKSFTLSLLLDGHTFHDDVYNEGYTFDYSTADCDSSLIRRSGINTTTGFFNTDETGELYTLYFREFTPYQELSGVQVCDIGDIENNINLGTTVLGKKVGKWKDAWLLTGPDNTPLPDALRTTDFNFPGGSNEVFYYETFVNGATFSTNVRDIEGWQDYNCGSFADVNLTDSKSNYYGVDNYELVNRVRTENQSTLSNLTLPDGGEINADRLNQAGKIFVKNQSTSLSQPLSSALNSTLGKYSSSIINDINNKLLDFDIIDDSIFLQTPDKLIIDKIKYTVDGKFTAPGTRNTVFEVDIKNSLNVFSTRLYVNQIKTCNNGGAVLFAIFKERKTDIITQNVLPKNYWYVYPEIYQYNVAANSVVKIFPLDDTCLESFKTSYNGSVTNYAPEKVRTPKVSYNSLYNKLKVSYIVLDQNNFSHIHDCLFEWQSGRLALERLLRYNPDHLTLRTTTFDKDTTFATINASVGSNLVIDFNTNLLCL